MVTVLLMDVASPEPILTLPKQISEVLLQKNVREVDRGRTNRNNV